jgi:hypothetical protein
MFLEIFSRVENATEIITFSRAKNSIEIIPRDPAATKIETDFERRKASTNR